MGTGPPSLMWLILQANTPVSEEEEKWEIMDISCKIVGKRKGDVKKNMAIQSDMNLDKSA